MDIDQVPVGVTKKVLQRSEAVDEERQLVDFIKQTMMKSLKDRNLILRIESDLTNFIKDKGRPSLPFPSMSSYHRMLVHRISSLFNLDHNIDPIGSCVVVSKSGKEKLVDFRFRELIEDTTDVKVLKREQSVGGGQKKQVQGQRSYEEREQDYQRVRSRIFQNNPVMKVESFDETRQRQSHSQSQQRNQFYKSSSFGGYGGQSQSGGGQNQDTISPASSGYKSLQVSYNTSCASSIDWVPEEQPPPLPYNPQYSQYSQPQSYYPPPLPLQSLPQMQPQMQQMQMQQMQYQPQPQIVYIPVPSELLNQYYYQYYQPPPPPQPQMMMQGFRFRKFIHK